ncbi:MAG: hypothetical protein WBA19_10190 [Psychroserpens sp.]
MRKRLIEWLFNHSQHLYTQVFKKHEAWGITKMQLLNYPKSTFGNHLGRFLQVNNFELIAKVERHDAYHTLTGYGTRVEDEIALQCLCFGNGKRSLYLYGAMLLGIVILPDYYRYYLRSYRIGKEANAFHHYNFKHLLTVNHKDFRDTIFSKSHQKRLILNSI